MLTLPAPMREQGQQPQERLRPFLYPPGTVVRHRASGRLGVVMLYDVEYATLLPVKMHGTQQWLIFAMLEVDKAEVVAPNNTGKSRATTNAQK